MSHKFPANVFAIFATILLSFHVAVAQQPVALDLKAKTPLKIVAYGDIRFLDPSNTKDSDPVRRKLIVQKIAEEKPAFVLISGDLVAKGDRAADWQVYDGETAPLKQANVRVLPTLGNHELRGDLTVALNNYFQRFPELNNSRWYSARAANVVVLTIDSSVLPGAPTLDQQGPGGQRASEAQSQWLRAQLASIPSDVDFVLFNLHHPPFTKSSDRMMGGGHSPRGAEQELAKQIEDAQAQSRAKFIVFAGHVHNYERYEHGGVEYIVSGGGGATPYEIPRSSDDHYRDPGPTYHICVLNVDKGRLEFSMLKLDTKGGKPSWSQRDGFTLTTSKAAAAGR